MRLTRRGLQLALGALWFLDGILQLQPFMLGTGFAKQIVAPAGEGEPQFVAGPVHWAANVIAAHPVALDVPFATVQLLLGVGLLAPPTAQLALFASIPWALGVWYFGEGLSGLASGHASLLTGAPGAALLYAVLAAAASPRGDDGAEPPAHWLTAAWVVLWVGAAVFQALPGQNTGTAVAATASAPASLGAQLAPWIRGHGTLVVASLVAVEALIGVSVLVRHLRVVAAAAGLLLAVVIWVFFQDLGQLATGQATDPNTGPLIMLIAVALLTPVRRTVRYPEWSLTASAAGGRR
jgi:hypothetical protein